MRKRLPEYRGALAPAPWSGIRFSEKTEDLLRKAALKECPACRGAGYLPNGQGSLIHLCHCVNRLPEGPGKRST